MYRLRNLLLLLPGVLASAQTIVTIAGLPYSHRAAIDGKPALNAPLSSVYGLLFDKLTDRLLLHDERLVSRLEPNRTLLAVVGMGQGNDGSVADGTLASGLRIAVLRGMAQDRTGALYLSEATGRVYRVSLDGVVTTFAGGGPNPPGPQSDHDPPSTPPCLRLAGSSLTPRAISISPRRFASAYGASVPLESFPQS